MKKALYLIIVSIIYFVIAMYFWITKDEVSLTPICQIGYIIAMALPLFIRPLGDYLDVRNIRDLYK